MTARRFNLGLIGFPLAHSLSPQMHTVALRRLGLDGEYRLYPIPPVPEGASQLQDLIAGLRLGMVDGLNVTIPHKRSVIPYLDELTPTARATGAVNTLLRQGKLLMGDNTDVAGFMTDMKRYLPGDINKKNALVLGAGGAARAVVYGLLRERWQVIVAARRLDQAEQLTEDLQDESSIPPGWIEPMSMADLSRQDFQERLHDQEDKLSLIVNTTPVGMAPHVDASPWPEGAAWPNRALAYDLVYNPRQTTWMRLADAAGLIAVGGLGMLIEQAALALELWTGLNPPRQAMAAVVDHVDLAASLPVENEGNDPR